MQCHVPETMLMKTAVARNVTVGMGESLVCIEMSVVSYQTGSLCTAKSSWKL